MSSAMQNPKISSRFVEDQLSNLYDKLSVQPPSQPQSTFSSPSPYPAYPAYHDPCSQSGTVAGTGIVGAGPETGIANAGHARVAWACAPVAPSALQFGFGATQEEKRTEAQDIVFRRFGGLFL